ncbi:uncharacterized protein EAE97_007641 [Botrytis byssoidea]|uniref:Uncharacterized protein n=1 Tax=Botrytis byssoidea TaxID=139641 RepID=A0A9P5LS24_9HELO|nr:uncharacterized protein EAE97_007641 [Botrytis byssoidea]KAF7937845.1 hypothetical protein EAE97_007641 [Botrytis byssoidea]
MSAQVPVDTVDYNLWFKDQQYGPGAYPTVDTLTFLCCQDAAIYNAKIRFQEETMRVHETIAPTTATAYDITDLSRHVFGYWEMMLGIAKADPVWAASYGGINTPRSFNSSWSRAKQHIRELIIKNHRAADQAAADAADSNEGFDNEGEEGSDEESVGSVIVVDYNNDGEESNDEEMDEDDEGGNSDGDNGDEDSDEENGGEEDSDEEMDDSSVIVVEYNDEEEEGYGDEMNEGDVEEEEEEEDEEEESDGEIVGFWWDHTRDTSGLIYSLDTTGIYEFPV